jgi:hypothetical protein
MNKDSNKIQSEDRVITPEVVFQAFQNLPTNYVKETQSVLKKWLSDGKINKSFSDRYIVKVRHNEENAFNETICRALVEVGLNHKKTKDLFSMKKAASTN